MTKYPTKIDGALLLRPRVFGDARGFFLGTWNKETFANGEVYHYLRDKGFLIKVPASSRYLYARGQKLLRLGTAVAEVPVRLEVSAERRLCLLAARGLSFGRIRIRINL